MKANTIFAAALMMLSCASANVMANGTRVFEAKYDPLLGRFLSPDNYVQEPFNTQNLNRYSYCLNNPVKYTDPDGNVHLPSFLKFWKAAAVISIFW